jgi:hypothetical protein
LTLISQASGRGRFLNFEEFKKGLLLIEFCFSGYVGHTLCKMFDSSKHQTQTHG